MDGNRKTTSICTNRQSYSFDIKKCTLHGFKFKHKFQKKLS